MTPRELESRRRLAYRLSPSQRIRTLEQASRWLGQVGFAWLFASRTAPELPSLYEVVKGRRGVQIEDWDADAEMLWAWKNDLPAIKGAYYGKALCGRPTLVSLKLLPFLYAHAGNEDFAGVYAHGAVSYEAKRIYDTLAQSGPQPTINLRRAAGLDSRGGQARYHRALDELQRKLYVLPIGATNETGAWPSQIFELVARWFPNQIARARELDSRQARQTLVKKYLQTVIAAKPAVIARLFGFTREQLSETLDYLIAHRSIRIESELAVTRLPAKGR